MNRRVCPRCGGRLWREDDGTYTCIACSRNFSVSRTPAKVEAKK